MTDVRLPGIASHALCELTDAILCADHAVTPLVQLSLVTVFRRGHAALADGRIDEDKLAALLTGTLLQLVDGEQDPPGSLGTTRSATACSRAPWPGPPGRRRRCGRRAPAGGGCGSRSTARLIPGRTLSARPAGSIPFPGWAYQLAAAIGYLRTAWAALTGVERTTPAARTGQTITQVKNLLRRLHAAEGSAAGPLVILA